MHIIHRILLLTLMGLLIIPQIASAAWWNPLSWKIYQITPKEVQSIDLQQVEEPNIKENSATKEHIIERPVTIDLSGIYERLILIKSR